MTQETEKTLEGLYRYYSYVQLNLQSLLLTSPTKERILKNIHHLKRTTYYANEDFSKETLAYREELREKVKALRKEGKVAYLNYKSIVVKERNDPQV